MKGFTAIYSSDHIRNIQYYFKSKNMETAKEFCENYFSLPVELIINMEVEHPYYGKGEIEKIKVLEEKGFGLMYYVNFSGKLIWVDAKDLV